MGFSKSKKRALLLFNNQGPKKGGTLFIICLEKRSKKLQVESIVISEKEFTDGTKTVKELHALCKRKKSTGTCKGVPLGMSPLMDSILFNPEVMAKLSTYTIELGDAWEKVLKEAVGEASGEASGEAVESKGSGNNKTSISDLLEHLNNMKYVRIIPKQVPESRVTSLRTLSSILFRQNNINGGGGECDCDDCCPDNCLDGCCPSTSSSNTNPRTEGKNSEK